MKTLADVLRILAEHRPSLAAKYGVTEVGVFGSYVRGTQRADSDIDVLVTLEEPPTLDLLDLVRLQDHLSELLDAPVDLALRGNLRKRIGERILREVVLV
ncbi:MAG: nucleotidyltransferase family protein [Anaerolineae bacterium]